MEAIDPTINANRRKFISDKLLYHRNQTTTFPAIMHAAEPNNATAVPMPLHRFPKPKGPAQG